MEYNIKITGSGTTDELITGLKNLINSIEDSVKSEHVEAILDGAEWKDKILMTEISAK